jgi:hypothetical protein
LVQFGAGEATNGVNLVTAQKQIRPFQGAYLVQDAQTQSGKYQSGRFPLVQFCKLLRFAVGEEVLRANLEMVRLKTVPLGSNRMALEDAVHAM